MSDIGEYSTINEFIENEIKSIPGNTLARKKSG